MAKEKDGIVRQIEFDPDLFERINDSAKADRRFFKWQVAALAKEALDAREKAMADG